MIDAARRRALGEAEAPPPAPLVPEHEAFLRSVSDQCTAALEHALLLEAERQSARDLELLAKATAALAASLDIELVAATIRELLVPYLADECDLVVVRSEEHTSELQSLMRISYAVFCLKKKKKKELAYNNTSPSETVNT